MPDTANVKIGVCKVTYDGTDLGYTKGGVEVAIATETHEVMVDQFGNTPINEYIMGRSVRVTVPLAETTLENLVEIMPGSTLVTDGSDPTMKRVDVTTGIGNNLLNVAKVLVLHPVGLPDNDVSEDFNIPLAATAGALTFAYKLDDERIYNVEFVGYPNSTTGNICSLGDLLAAALTFTATNATNVLTATGHTYVAGDSVVLAVSGAGALPDPLVAAKTYFVTDVSGNDFKLCYTQADALANAGSGQNVISINDDGTGTLKVSAI